MSEREVVPESCSGLVPKEALDKALARVEELEAEGAAVIDCLNLYAEPIVHKALDAAGLLKEGERE